MIFHVKWALVITCWYSSSLYTKLTPLRERVKERGIDFTCMLFQWWSLVICDFVIPMLSLIYISNITNIYIVYLIVVCDKNILSLLPSKETRELFTMWFKQSLFICKSVSYYISADHAHTTLEMLHTLVVCFWLHLSRHVPYVPDNVSVIKPHQLTPNLFQFQSIDEWI